MIEKHNKKWGWEEWIVNNELYCGKKLVFVVTKLPTSMHFHVKKHETMLVERGWFRVTTIDARKKAERKVQVLTPGDTITIPQLMPHRIEAIELLDGAAILTEFSTHHEESDSYRIEL